ELVVREDDALARLDDGAVQVERRRPRDGREERSAEARAPRDVLVRAGPARLHRGRAVGRERERKELLQEVGKQEDSERGAEEVLAKHPDARLRQPLRTGAARLVREEARRDRGADAAAAHRADREAVRARLRARAEEAAEDDARPRRGADAAA